jgi:hypothetical protein
MEKSERLTFASHSFEDQIERIREVVNEHDTRIEALEQEIPKAYGPPKYPPVKTKEKCEELGGKWDDEKKTCELPKKKEIVEGILPTSRGSSNEEARAQALIDKVLKEEE